MYFLFGINALNSGKPKKIMRIKKIISNKKIIFLLYAIRSAIRYFLAVFRWYIPILFQIIVPARLKPKRVLIIYDTKSQPFSIGDFLLFMEVSLVLCQKYHLEIVDVALLYSPRKPYSGDRVFKKKITKDNIFYNLSAILPLAQINQFLGSVLLFDSDTQIRKYVHDNIFMYKIWPSSWQLSNRQYLMPDIFSKLFYHHYKKYKSLPELKCRPFLTDWAKDFYNKNTTGLVPVTVNIRSNKNWRSEHNSKIDVWLDFFKHCEKKYPVKFIIICARSEVDDRFRKYNNVIIAKDHLTGSEEDIALILTSAFRMASNSGPFTAALFNKKPYSVFNMILEKNSIYHHPDMFDTIDNGVQKFWFASEFQRVVNDIETLEILIREFVLLWESVDIKKWKNTEKINMHSNHDINLWLR